MNLGGVDRGARLKLAFQDGSFDEHQEAETDPLRHNEFLKAELKRLCRICKTKQITLDEFLMMCHWKSPRAVQQYSQNKESVRISEGRGLAVIDNYRAAIAHPKRAPEQRPKAWAHIAVRQFELKEVSIPE